MQGIKKYITQNYLNIIVIIVSLFITIFSFYQYFQDYYGYAPKYYELERECKQNKNEQSCKEFNIFSPDENPKVKFHKLDAITLTCEIVENHAFFYMGLLAPLFIIIITINRMHKEINSGMFKYYLTRMKYKEYLKRILLTSLKPALLIPILLIMIFIISCIITGFNFNVDKEVLEISVYEPWKYNNFILYGIIICVIQYLMALFYGNLGLIFCKKNKNKVISVFLGYITYFAIDIIFYVVIYALILCRWLRIDTTGEMMRYFNISDYLHFEAGTNLLFVILIACIFAISSGIALYNIYKNKEGVILANEKENG